MIRDIQGATQTIEGMPAFHGEWLGSGESPVMPVSVRDYTDYRAFLRDSFAAAKAMGNPVSNRWLARRLGFRSFSFITMLLQGKRNLTKPNRGKFARLLNLDAGDAEYFSALVECNQAVDPEDKERALLRLAALQQPAEDRLLATADLKVGPEGRARIEALLDEFRRRAEAIAADDPGEGTEYRLDVRLFPRARVSAPVPELPPSGSASALP